MRVRTMDALRLLETRDPWEWPKEAQQVVLATLGDEDPTRRRRAASLAYGVMDDHIAARLLDVLLEDGDEDVRAAAAIAFGPALEECDTSDFDDTFDSPPLAEACFNEIRRILERVYRDGEVPTLVRRRALEAAVRAPEPWQRGATRAAWRSSDDQWRKTAVLCMGYLGGFDLELLEALEHPEFLEMAVVAIGQCGAEAAAQNVLALARSSTDRRIRLAAIEALGNLHPPQALDLLLDYSVSNDEEIACVASEALALRGDGLYDLSAEDEFV